MSAELKQRIITAAVVIPAVVLCVCYLDTPVFALLLALLISMGAWEWAGISGYRAASSRAVYIFLILLACLGCYLLRATPFSEAVVTTANIWWLISIYLIVTYRQGGNGILAPRLVKGGVGFLVLVPPWLGMVLLHGGQAGGAWLVLFLLVMIWIADSAAYFSGRRWGKTRLAREVSPGKSWEGVLGALLATLAFSLPVALLKDMQDTEILVFLFVCLVTVAASIVGDLMESLMKRQSGVKDSGTLLPGHGGVLDRIDSLTAATPVFLSGLWLSGVVS